jgi:ABC-type branched-subunit amino acid transport system substrate-binding protein
MDALKAKNPDLVVMSSYGAGAGYLLDARQKLGWTVPTIGDLAISASKLPNNPNALAGVKMQVFGATVLSNKSNWQPAEEAAIKQITAQGPITTGATQPLYPYDAIQMLAAAAKQEKGTSADKLKAGLENLKSPNPVPWTMFASFGYTAKDHYPSPPKGAWAYIPAGEATNGFYQ